MNVYVEKAIDELVEREGGYVDHPSDRGGPTNWGITEQVARAHGYTGHMRNLPRARAEEIYRTMYWIAPRFDHIAKRIPKVAYELFDTGVNMGPKRAAKFLQRALNVLNKRAGAYPDIVVDGDIGLMTLSALDGLIKSRGRDAAEKALFRLLDSQQAVKYMEIAEADPKQEDFMFGWVMNRVRG